jgi:nucleoside phosphorylase
LDKVLIVTATKVEAEEVLAQFCQASGAEGESCFIGRKTYCALGEVGGVELYMVQSEMGSGTPGGSAITVSKAINDISPIAVILVGICFGSKDKGQKLGHILVSKQLHSYEPQKVTSKRWISLGDTVTASEDLLDKFRHGDLKFKGVRRHFGLMLSGEKLIKDLRFRQRALKEKPQAIGGEMEGAGFYVAARDAGVHWIIVKAICDWADEKKDDKWQRKAARNAAAFTLHVIQQGGMTHLRHSGKQTGFVSSGAGLANKEKPSTIPSTIPARFKPFVGRDTELAEMLTKLADTSREKVLVLHGQSGAGKSELGMEFARTQQSRYPGGTFLIRAGSGGVAIDLAGIGKNILGPNSPRI